MSHEIRANYDQIWLLPPSLDDLLPADHPARFIREYVDALDLCQLGFKMRKGEEGRPNYAPDLLLKVWVYGYLERVRSSRRLEKACRHDLALVWLTGMNYPDHNSLWRFWNDNRKALKEVFRQTIRVAAKADLIGMALHALDGTKVTARASTGKMWGRKILQEKLQRLDKSLQEMVAEVEQSEQQEAGQECRLPEELANKQALRETVRAKLAELEKEDRAHMHPGERDAKVVKNHEGKRLGYNAQVVVEGKSGLIVAADVSNEQNDLQQLVPMLERVQEELGAVAEETVADAGYWSGKQLAKAEEAHFPVLVSLAAAEANREAAGPYNSSQFTYDKEKDCYSCPRGEQLRYQKTRKEANSRVYRCHSFQDCPVRWECSKDKQGRSVERSPYCEALLAQEEKQRDAAKKKLLRLRMPTVEPVFAVVKNLLGFRRCTVGGLDKVRSQWWFVCTVVNLLRMYRFWRVGKLEFA
jgi:transposase